jgi:hypothetical protein
MILDQGPRALICAGVFCLAAPIGGGARAAEVYPGCAVPPTTFNHVWYVDPVNGKTVSAGGLGTQAAPWNSLQAIFSASSGYKYPLLTTAPYVRNPTTGLFSPGPDAGPIQPGDEILLMSGNYGDIAIGSQYGGANNSPAFVTIAAAPGQAPVLTLLYIMSSSGFVVSGLKVQSLGAGRIPLVSINSADPTHSTSNIILHNLNVSSADPSVYATWTQPEWVANTRVGVSAKGGGFRREVQPRRQHWFLNEKSGFPFRTPAFCSVSRGQRRLGEEEYRAPSVTPGVALRPRTQGRDPGFILLKKIRRVFVKGARRPNPSWKLQGVEALVVLQRTSDRHQDRTVVTGANSLCAAAAEISLNPLPYAPQRSQSSSRYVSFPSIEAYLSLC